MMMDSDPRLSYWIGKADERALRLREFEYAVRRSASERMARGIVHTYKPVMDDAPYRIFPTLRAYVEWCAQALPSWLGYGRADR